MCLCLVFQSCPTLCNPMDCSLPGSSVYRILQARVLEWVAMPSCRGSSQPRAWTWDSFITAIADGKDVFSSFLKKFGCTRSKLQHAVSLIDVLVLSRVWLFATSYTVACQAPLFMGFSRQDYWSELPFPSPGHLLNPGIEPASPTLAGGFFSTELPEKPRRDVLSKTSRATSWGHSMVNMPAWPSKHWPPRLSKCRAESTESCLGSGYGAIRETPSVLAMFWSRGQQAPSTIWLATCFRTARKKRMVLPFLNGWGKNIKRRIIFHDMWKWYESGLMICVVITPLVLRGS